MDNTARDIFLFDTDLEQFEADIRADERQRVREEMRQRRRAREAARRARINLYKRYALQRIIGVAIIMLSIAAVYFGWTYDATTGMNDGTFLILTIPLGLYVTFTRELMF
jgi:hypothetical protein